MSAQTTDEHQPVMALRVKAIALLEEMSEKGLAADAALSEAVVAMQSVVHTLGKGTAALCAMPAISQDAAIVVALASTAIPFATNEHDEAERWLRVMRLYGQVGTALQALGVPEGPLETPAEDPVARRRARREEDGNPVAQVLARARELALQRGSPTTGTLEVLFAVLAVYGESFDRALYSRGTTRDELLDHLAERVAATA